MSERAILLTNAGSAEVGNVAKLLGFFGVESEVASLDEFLSYSFGLNGNDGKSLTGGRIFCSSDVFEQLIQRIDQDAELLHLWKEQARSAFVYAGADLRRLEHSARRLTQGDAVIEELPPGPVEFKLTSELDSVCGAMASIVATASARGFASCHVLRTSGAEMVNIISTRYGAIFAKLNCHSIPVFLSTCRDIVNLDNALPNGTFDIRDHVASALPIVLYVKWAFPGTCWGPAEINGCLVIDDPLLKPNYGFINFHRLWLGMQQHRFSTSIAFIPWNSRRSASDVVKLFKDNPDYYSLSVHGCDHGRAEFGTEDSPELYGKARRALERMTEHESTTGLSYDRVMVFPQGVFSKAAPTALKHAGFIAAANNDTVDVGTDPIVTRVRDFWDTAVMKYDGFPIFTRRYPWEGIENFAFDMLLGKPAIAVIHHDYCGDDYERLTDFIDRLNLLNCSITWRSLGDVVRRSYRRKTISPDSVEVDMYATELFLKNSSDHPTRYLIRRRETRPSLIEEIRTESGHVVWDHDADAVSFEVHLRPGESITVSIQFYDLATNGCYNESLTYKAKTMARRYLCEVRDNYLVTSKHRIAGLFGGRKSEDSGQSAAVERALSNFIYWLASYGENSWDHQSFFAGPVGRRAKSLYYRNRLLGTAAVAPMIFAEAFVPSARRLFHRPTRFPIADAHYAMGFGFLYETTGDINHLDRAIHFLNELKNSRSPGFQEHCWGYPFDWVWRGGTIKAQTPLITTTPYCFEAFLQVYQLVKSSDIQLSTLNHQLSTFDDPESLKEIVESIARHVGYDIRDFKTSESASSCSYTTDDEGGVINAAAYRAFVMASASQVFSNDAYWRIADRNLNFVLENQNPDGSWFYATDGVRDFVDHYHTCFVMKALAKIHRLTGDDRCLDALSKGVDYYLNNLFAEDGLPKPFSRAPRLTVYNRELYDCAECINLCVLLCDRFPRLQETLHIVLTDVLDNWIKPDGSFRSRRLHFGWDNVPMHRWGQSQMFRALAFYLCEESKTEKLKSETLKTPEDRHLTLRVKDQPQLLNLSPSQLS
jgi:hypothetical protein